MGITIVELMSAGMSYEEAVNFQLKFFAIMIVIVVALYFIRWIIKKHYPKFYKILKQHNIF